MYINQNFRRLPDDTLLNTILDTFRVKSLMVGARISVLELEDMNIVSRMNTVLPVLMDYYVPCKARKYLTDLTPRKCVNVMRQVFKAKGIVISCKERIVMKRKDYVYTIVEINNEDVHTYSASAVVTFD